MEIVKLPTHLVILFPVACVETVNIMYHGFDFSSCMCINVGRKSNNKCKKFILKNNKNVENVNGMLGSMNTAIINYALQLIHLLGD